jgi:RNA-directed DNA polymerase
MRESYREGPASHSGPESCADGREAGREALTGVCAGRVLSHETFIVRGADAVSVCGRQHPGRRQGETLRDPAGSETSSMHRDSSRENREIPYPPAVDGAAGRAGKPDGTSQR